MGKHLKSSMNASKVNEARFCHFNFRHLKVDFIFSMVRINRLLSADGSDLYIHTIFPKGTQKQCQRYIAKIRAGLKNQISEEVFQMVAKHLKENYGRPGFIPGFTFNGGICFIVIITACVSLYMGHVYITIKTWPIRKLKKLDLISKLGSIDEMAKKLASFRSSSPRQNTDDVEQIPMTS